MRPCGAWTPPARRARGDVLCGAGTAARRGSPQQRLVRPPVPRGAPVPLGGGRTLPAIIEIGCAYRLALAANHLDCGRLVDSWDL